MVPIAPSRRRHTGHTTSTTVSSLDGSEHISFEKIVFHAEKCTCLHEDEPNHGGLICLAGILDLTLLFTSEAFAKQRRKKSRGFMKVATIFAVHSQNQVTRKTCMKI
jgi:hypothetical protein